MEEMYAYEDVVSKIFNDKDSNWKPSDKIPIVAKEIDKIKSNLRSFVKESYLDFDSIFSQVKELHDEGINLTKEMEECQNEVKNKTLAEIIKSQEMQKKLDKELDKMDFLNKIMYDITTSGQLVKEFEECKKVQSFSRAVESIIDLQSILEHPSEGYNRLSMYTNIKATAAMIWDQLINDLHAQWEKLVSYNLRTEGNITTVTIKVNIDEERATFDVLHALEISKQMWLKINHLATFLLNEVLIPLLRHDCNVFTESGDLCIITIKNESPKQPFEVVLANTKKFVDFLNIKFQIEYGNHHTLMKLLGVELSRLYSGILIKEFLIDTVPNSLIDLQNYSRVTDQIEEFQNHMQEIHFFTESISLLKYIEDIDVLFAEKCTQNLLETARSIMLKDLSVTMSIGVETIPEINTPTIPIETEGVEDTLKVFETYVPKSLLYFPRCMISKSTQELLDLIYMMMEQAVQCPDSVSKRLYESTRLVFELYDAVVPYHHEKYLMTIPQYVALFHNNCMYLAHHLLALGDKWLRLMEGRRVPYPISFVDLGGQLRELGGRMLARHAQHQRAQLMDALRASDLNRIMVRDVLNDTAEQAVRQCLRQLQLLKNVWIGVFPPNVFTRLMGTLVTVLVEELAHRVCSAEDVAAAMAAQLADIYTIVLNKAPLLFQNPTDIEEHVKPWIKLQELILILGGTLKDIEKRWDDGTGPLAIHFRTEELRSLVKALFQNTQVRANLLSKMK